MTNKERANMQNFTVSCLCIALTFKSKRAPFRTFNCHCEDCRKCSGAPYLINIFVNEATLDIQGNLKSYVHQSESGNRNAKKFCEKCGFQMFSFSEGRPGLVRIHAGKVSELKMVKPQGDVWVSKKIPSIKMDETFNQFERNFT
tara:strand:+ start:219 stop:650 length:432 start_codon:yes stop_codon:yes gene_type:complete